MKAEIAQLRQEHDPPVRTFSGQALQPVEHVLFERRAERIVRVMERGGGKAIAPHADDASSGSSSRSSQAIKTL
jgi:hypothetical protein